MAKLHQGGLLSGRLGNYVYVIQDGRQIVRAVPRKPRKPRTSASAPRNRWEYEADVLLSEPEQHARWQAYADHCHYTTPATRDYGPQTCNSLRIFVAACLMRSLDTPPIDLPLDSHC